MDVTYNMKKYVDENGNVVWTRQYWERGVIGKRWMYGYIQKSTGKYRTIAVLLRNKPNKRTLMNINGSSTLNVLE